VLCLLIQKLFFPAPPAAQALDIEAMIGIDDDPAIPAAPSSKFIPQRPQNMSPTPATKPQRQRTCANTAPHVAQ